MPLAAVAILLCFLRAVTGLSDGQAEEEMRQIEESVRRAAVACYATEGAYPPDLAYLQQRYGLQLESDRYMISYEAIASNLMPEITVLEK